MHKHSTPKQGLGARTSTAPTPARQTPQTNNTRQRRPYGGGDNRKPTKQAEHRAGYNTTNRNPNTPTQHAPLRGGHTQTRHVPTGGGGGRAPAQHQPWPSKGHNRNRNQPNRRRQPKPNTTKPRTTTAAGRHQHSTPHQEGGHAPTKHAPPRGGPQTNAARPTMGGATHQHSTAHHRGGHAQTQHAATGVGGRHQHSTNPGQANTTDNQHPTTPAVQRRGQQETNKTSRASSRLQHHEPKR